MIGLRRIEGNIFWVSAFVNLSSGCIIEIEPSNLTLKNDF
jgi:hypothetical protein